MLETRKLLGRSMSLHDRVNKSDAEDKSLSNDETPLPTCPRQPPDGVETPSDVVEKIPEPSTRLPPRLPVGWPNTRSRFSYSSRTQDARSEASVKDKIAMFSNDHSVSSDRLDKCGTLPTRTSLNGRKNSTSFTTSYIDVSSLDRRLTKSQDNLDEPPRAYKRHTDRPAVLGALENTPTTSKLGIAKTNKSLAESKPLFYGSTTTLPSSTDTSFVQPISHVRSISDDNTKPNKNVHKSNLEYLIEQRKKSMSKLRGLAIPEAQGPIVDLPEIKVQDTISKSLFLKSNQNNINNKDNKTNNTKSINLSETKWKANLLPNNIPKYSPAFKRKSLQVYTPSSLSKESTPERKICEKVDVLNRINEIDKNTSKSNRNILDSNNVSERLATSTTTSKYSFSNSTKLPNKGYKDILNDVREYKNVEIKLCTATDVIDSDNDSAMSSTQSSYRSSASSPLHNLDSIESDSSRISPRITHYTSYSLVKTEIPTKSSNIEKNCEEYVKRNVCRSMSSETNVSLSSSAGSAATSGSQASCSSLESSVADIDKRKISKTYNIDTINRRNILASAKCRSGRDSKLKSPVVESKFTHEAPDELSSPTVKASERLATLTPTVSAMSNKGENRRRNKIIAETDSESDSEVNVRQRKTEYKNTRLKRNSSSANKNKLNELTGEAPKDEDIPRYSLEKLTPDTEKVNYGKSDNNNLTTLSDINNVSVKKTDNPIKKKEDNNFNTEIILTHVKTNLLNVEKTPMQIKNKGSSSDKIDSPVENVKIPTHTIKLKRGAATGVGLILAGGVDCEAKDVTVHRVLADSVAAKAGLKRGAKILSINGSTMNGLTHAQSVAILKEQRSEVVIEIEDETRENVSCKGCGSENAESKERHEVVEVTKEDNSNGSIVTVQLEKAGGGAGLGFGLDGGRDSPHGDRPLTIKKLFAGGAAAQSGRILVGAILLSAGGQSMEGFTRTQAWAALKALPAGQVTLVLRNPKTSVNS